MAPKLINNNTIKFSTIKSNPNELNMNYDDLNRLFSFIKNFTTDESPMTNALPHHLQIGILGTDNSLIRFQINPETPLRKLIKKYCQLTDQPRNSLRFRMDGCTINENATAGSCLQTGDTIEVFNRQIGRGNNDNEGLTSSSDLSTELSSAENTTNQMLQKRTIIPDSEEKANTNFSHQSLQSCNTRKQRIAANIPSRQYHNQFTTHKCQQCRLLILDNTGHSAFECGFQKIHQLEPKPNRADTRGAPPSSSQNHHITYNECQQCIETTTNGAFQLQREPINPLVPKLNIHHLPNIRRLFSRTHPTTLAIEV